jgi:hypothetical protein
MTITICGTNRNRSEIEEAEVKGQGASGRRKMNPGNCPDSMMKEKKRKESEMKEEKHNRQARDEM